MNDELKSAVENNVKELQKIKDSENPFKQVLIISIITNTINYVQ